MGPDRHQHFLPRILRAGRVMVPGVDRHLPVAVGLEVLIAHGVEGKARHGKQGRAVGLEQFPDGQELLVVRLLSLVRV